MTGHLLSNSFEIEGYYPRDPGEFYDLLGGVFLTLPVTKDLQHLGLEDQLLKSTEGNFLLLFGGLNRIKGELDDETFHAMSREISAAFYRLKWDQLDEFYAALRNLEELLKAGIQKKKTANDA